MLPPRQEYVCNHLLWDGTVWRVQDGQTPEGTERVRPVGFYAGDGSHAAFVCLA